MPFALDPESAISEITGAINYLLANLTDALTVNPGTGEIFNPDGTVYGYLYKYIHIKYADSYDGALNFSDSPTNRQYYGVRNDNQLTEPTNPADYTWYNVAGGFGTTKFLFYQVFGGRQIDFFVGTTSPGDTWVQEVGNLIDLDISTTSVGTTNLQAYLVQPQTSSSPVLPSFTIGPTLPTGWSATPPVCPVGSVLWYAFGAYNGTTHEIDGIPANNTKWTGPVAAVVFQDIRSDNWDGSNPPVYGNTATYGTQGYYISRTTGYIYANGLVARGRIQSGSNPLISGTSMTGTGGILYETGQFAVGSSTNNMVWDGSNLYLNGVVTATTTNSTGVDIWPGPNPLAPDYLTPQTTLATFTKTRSGYVQIFGNMNIIPFNSAYPNWTNLPLQIRVYDSLNVLKAIQVNVCVLPTAFYSTVTWSLLVNLNPGTYRVVSYVEQPQYWNLAFSSSTLYNPATDFVDQNTVIYVYEAKIS